MKSVYISDSLHRRAKAMAAAQGIPLNQFIERLLKRALDQSGAAQAEKPQVQERLANYDTAAPAQQVAAGPQGDPWYDKMVAEGRLIPPEQVRKWVHESYLQMRRELGLKGPPPAEPPSIEEVRDIFQRQRELHPDLPTLSEILREMREEE